MCGTARPDVMVEAEARSEWENPWGGGVLSPMDGCPKDSTHMAGLEPAPQGVFRPIERVLFRGGLDNTTNRTAGGWRKNYPTNRLGNGSGTDGVREENASDPPSTRFDGPRTPGGG